jgi:uncharacterized protein (DUF305 family)
MTSSINIPRGRTPCHDRFDSAVVSSGMTRSRLLPTLFLPAILAQACAPRPADPEADSTAAAADSTPVHDMAGMSTGDADRDFLRMMSSHHKGLITLAHESMLRGSRGTSQSQDDAAILDARQDRELETMVGMLKTYGDSTPPVMLASDQAMIDSVLKVAGPEYAQAFYKAVVSHHKRAIGMIDDYLPKAKREDVKAMAIRMRQDHQTEIVTFERKR